MATHPHGPISSTNGHGSSGLTQRKLESMLADYETKANAIRTTLQLLTGHDLTKKKNGHTTVLAEALALDGARTTKRSHHGHARGAQYAAMLETRRVNAAFLAGFDPKTPRTPAEVAAAVGVRAKGIGPLVYKGYLRKKRKGYIRTAKPYDPLRKGGGGSSASA